MICWLMSRGYSLRGNIHRPWGVVGYMAYTQSPEAESQIPVDCESAMIGEVAYSSTPRIRHYLTAFPVVTENWAKEHTTVYHIGHCFGYHSYRYRGLDIVPWIQALVSCLDKGMYDWIFLLEKGLDTKPGCRPIDIPL